MAKFRQNFVRFRLYRRRSLQVNTRLTALFKIYQGADLPDYVAQFFEINPLRGGGAEAPGFLLRVDERRGIGKLLQTWYFLGMVGPVANHISLQK